MACGSRFPFGRFLASLFLAMSPKKESYETMNQKVACSWVENALVQLGRSGKSMTIGVMVDEELELMKHLKERFTSP